MNDFKLEDTPLESAVETPPPHGTLELSCEDCMVLMARYPDKHFDLAIVDPPYGIDINSSGRLGHYGGKGKTWDADIPATEYFAELRRVSAHQVIWGGNYFPLPPTRCFLIWDKQQPEGMSFADAEYAWTSLNESARIFRMRPQNADPERIHPTQKPVALYRWLLERYAKPGQHILDTHLGSMSSVIACIEHGFEITGCEIDPDYFAQGMERVKKYMDQMTFPFLRNSIPLSCGTIDKRIQDSQVDLPFPAYQTNEKA